MTLLKQDYESSGDDQTAAQLDAAMSTLNTLLGGSGATVTLADNVFTIVDNSDTTKKWQVELSGIATGTTRTWTVPNASSTFVGTDVSQTLTAKTLTAPVLNGTPTGTGVATAATASTLALRDSNAILTALAFARGFTSTATAAGTTTDTVGSSQIQEWTGATTQTHKLATTSVPLGYEKLVINNSSGAVTVQSSDATQLVILAANTSALFTAVQATPTSGSHWDTQYFGIIIFQGKKLTVSNTLTFDGTDGTTFTFPSTTGTVYATGNTDVSVADGGTGRSTSTTAYGLIAAGTTATGAHQTLAAGATTEILVGAGASALPVWTTATGSGSPVRATSPTLTTPTADTLTVTTGIDVGNTDTTVTRASAGDIAVESNIVYRAGGTDVPVADGGTGRSTGTTAYALVATGTTATGVQQTCANGATTEVLVGGGASALPVWTTATGSGAPVRTTSPTIVTPTIASFANAAHDHTNAAGGAQLTDAALSSQVTVAKGGTGRVTSTTAYGLIAAGTTATGAHQTLAAGATTELLVGGGASALPAWTTATGSGAPVRATSPTLVTPTVDTLTTTGNIELGHATATTLSGSAGVLSVEGVVVPTISSTNTLTNKAITPRAVAVTLSATPAIDCSITDLAIFAALNVNITNMSTNLTNTPTTSGGQMNIRFKDDGTPRTIAWGTLFQSSGVNTLLATTAANKTHLVRLMWDNSAGKFICVYVDATGY